MKFSKTLITLFACIGSSNAFSAVNPNIPSSSMTKVGGSNPPSINNDSGAPEFEIFPEKYESILKRIDGGGTIKSCKLPTWATRVQYKIETFGRPAKGEVNLWLGPGRSTHTLKFDTESGVEFPIEATLKFKNGHDGAPVMRVSTTEDYCFPMKFSAFVPSSQRALELEANTEKTFLEATKEEKLIIQGSQTDGKQGAWKYWNIPQEVDSIQLIGWSTNTGKKSFKVQCELLQGPNNVKQSVMIQCGGGSQPYHMVLQTPGSGWVVRMQNKKFMEDGLIEFVVKPYTTKEVESKDLALWSDHF